MTIDETGPTTEAEERAAGEARIDEAVMTLARLLGRQLARENFNGTLETLDGDDNSPPLDG